MSETHQITAVAIRAAREAGEIALQGFRSAGLEVSQKADMHDVVTRFDRASEACIREVILAEYPNSTIVGEEEGTAPGTDGLTWYVDPIDGTSNYARGIAMWAVSIGVARDGRLVAGVIFDPANGQLFWADDRGAFLSGGRDVGEGGDLGEAGEAGEAGEDQPLRSTGFGEPSRATVALNFPLARDLVHLPELALDQFARVTRSFAQVRGIGSTCIALAWVAAGWLDATVSFETNPWDVAAGAFIIERAGGSFLGYEAGAVVAQDRAHLAPHYYATVRGGQYELLEEIMRTQSARPGKG